MKILTAKDRIAKIKRDLVYAREKKMKEYDDAVESNKRAAEISHATIIPIKAPRKLEKGLLFPKDFRNVYPKIIQCITEDLEKEQGFHYFIRGTVGSGKTYLAFTISQTIEQIYGNSYDYHGFEVKWVNCEEVYYDWLNLRESTPSNKFQLLTNAIKRLRGNCVIFDDIGAELPQTDAAHAYVAKILTDRYNCFKQGFIPFSIDTSNMDADSINDMYGSRVLRRINEMCTIIQLSDNVFGKKRAKIYKEG